MGLLTVGSPLDWPETKKNAVFVQKQGIKQFILLYHKLNSRTKHTLKWGDEIEYTLVRFDPLKCKAQLYLGATELLKVMGKENNTGGEITWQPEYAEYMIEGVPGIPFGRLLHAFSTVESNMRKRRLDLMTHLPKGCVPLTICAFPRLGCDDFCYPAASPTPDSGVSRSLFYPDAAINQGHPRFKTLTRNIRERRGAKIAINVPIYQDTHTPQPFIEKFPESNDPNASSAALPNHVYLDAMGFGMGCSCLQITFQIRRFRRHNALIVVSYPLEGREVHNSFVIHALLHLPEDMRLQLMQYVDEIAESNSSKKRTQLMKGLESRTPECRFPANPERYVHNFSSVTVDKL
ncbi:unnamed protein product [Trichobilharzia regenti]|nr:unnamed protein product [Trichobilharzia regenti]